MYTVMPAAWRDGPGQTKERLFRFKRLEHIPDPFNPYQFGSRWGTSFLHEHIKFIGLQ
jgi:hypothetical protein